MVVPSVSCANRNQVILNCFTLEESCPAFSDSCAPCGARWDFRLSAWGVPGNTNAPADHLHGHRGREKT